jgi:hypothetical protein
MKVTSILSALFLGFSSTVMADEDIGLCCLCGSCRPVVRGRGGLPIDSDGTTCNELLLDMADPTNQSTQGNAKCRQLITRHRTRCCDASHNPVHIVQAPTPAPNWDMPLGDQPVCNICHDGSYPSKPMTIVSVLERFIPGVNTCDKLYRMGLTGNIPDQICNPLVDFVDRPCGCSNIPTQHPTVVRGTNAPTASPTNFATTSSPSLSPMEGIPFVDFPPKKEVPGDFSKDDTSKLFQDDIHGLPPRDGLHRKQRRGTRLRGLK